MEWQQLLSDGYDRIAQVLRRALDGLSREELDAQPKADCNSIGWLAWHLTRVQDNHLADLEGVEQLWTGDGWHARFDRPADPADVGWGHTPEQVAAFRSPDAQTLLDYHLAVSERTKRYFGSLAAADLDRELNEPRYQPLPTVGVRIISVLADNLQHAGQAAYVRGYLRGMRR
jgi:uncharacterized damage-inducible protein DinB